MMIKVLILDLSLKIKFDKLWLTTVFYDQNTELIYI